MGAAKSARACSGETPGDLSANGRFAAHETDQIAVERAIAEIGISVAQFDAGDAGGLRAKQQELASWGGGFARDAFDGGGL